MQVYPVQKACSSLARKRVKRKWSVKERPLPATGSLDLLSLRSSPRFSFFLLLSSWSSSEMQWVKVGDVVGAAGQSDSTKTLYQGKEYDYVFSVDIAEGQPPLKLPYNMTDDPWQAAQKFIHDNDLSQYYLDTVANFIITNSKGGGGSQPQGAPSSNGSTYTDPFTGGSRYMPGTPAHPAAAAAAVPAEPSQAVDPFTGGGRYIPQGAGEPAGAKKPQNTFFPVKTFLRFDQANLEAITSTSVQLIC